MNTLYVSLAGVAVGWALNEFSAFFRARSAKKTLLGLAATRLLQLERQMRTLSDVLETMKGMSRSWKEYEGLRQHCVNRYIESNEELAVQAKEAVPIVAAYLPLQAMQLEGMYRSRSFTRKMRFGVMADSPQTYIKAISAMEAADEISANELRQLTIRIARMHGFITWFRIWRFFRKADRLRQPNRSAMGHLFVEEFRSASNADEQIGT